MTYIEWAQRIAAEYGVEWGDAEADYVLWTFTCFPVCTDRKVEAQLRELLSR